MANILIIGNITKDTYLALDPSTNHLELDSQNTPWLDLPFNASSHHFFRRTSIYGGATVSLEVLTKLGHSATISNHDVRFDNGSVIVPSDTLTDHRYILSHEDNITYFSPTTRLTTHFSPPSSAIDCIYIDRSANLTPDLADKILNYLSLSQDIKLAIFINARTPHIQPLLNRADFLFTDTSTFSPDNAYKITNSSISITGNTILYSLSDKSHLITTLTSCSTISATLLATALQGESIANQLLFAKYNVELSTLSETISLAKLKEQIMSQEWQVKDTDTLRATAKRLLAENKGILAADESGGSIHKKFESMGIPDDEPHRRDYRNIFFTTEDLEKHASGVILFDETARQKADDGTDFVTFLSQRGVIPGIKVDQGLEEQPSGETLTKGLDDLPARLAEYYNMGLRFAKWRAAFQITDTTPTDENIQQNCDILAQYAKDCQSAGIVPIVEPEVVYDGDYPIEKSAEVTEKILKTLVASLESHQVDLPATIVKCNMVLAGKKQPQQSTPEEVGIATAQVLRASLPDTLAGVVFLSGGQSVDQATDNLQAVTNNGPFPWPVTFSFARALQDPALEAWHGDNANADAARTAFLSRLLANTSALTNR